MPVLGDFGLTEVATTGRKGRIRQTIYTTLCFCDNNDAIDPRMMENMEEHGFIECMANGCESLWVVNMSLAMAHLKCFVVSFLNQELETSGLSGGGNVEGNQRSYKKPPAVAYLNLIFSFSFLLRYQFYVFRYELNNLSMVLPGKNSHGRGPNVTLSAKLGYGVSVQNYFFAALLTYSNFNLLTNK